MFAQTRLSVGIGFGGHGAGFYQPPPSYASNIPPCPGPGYTWVDGYWSEDYGRNTWVAGYWNRQPFTSAYQVAPSFDNRFNDGDDRRGFTRDQQDRNRSFDQGRNFSEQDRNQTRGFNQGQSHDFGHNQNQNQNRGNGNRSNGQDNRQGNGYANGFRGREPSDYAELPDQRKAGRKSNRLFHSRNFDSTHRGLISPSEFLQPLRATLTVQLITRHACSTK